MFLHESLCSREKHWLTGSLRLYNGFAIISLNPWLEPVAMAEVIIIQSEGSLPD